MSRTVHPQEIARRLVQRYRNEVSDGSLRLAELELIATIAEALKSTRIVQLRSNKRRRLRRRA